MKEAAFPYNLCLNKFATAPNPTTSVDLINLIHSFIPIRWPRSMFSTISPMSDLRIKSCARPIFLNTSTLLHWLYYLILTNQSASLRVTYMLYLE